MINLIKFQDLVDICGLSVAFDESVADIRINTVQDMYIIGFLGKEFYTEIISKLTDLANDIPLPVAYETLINGDGVVFKGLKPYVAWLTMAEIVKTVNVHFTQMGAHKSPDVDGMKGLSETEIQYLVESYLNKANIYKVEVVRHLNSNKALFPLWKDKTIVRRQLPFSFGSNKKFYGTQTFPRYGN